MIFLASGVIYLAAWFFLGSFEKRSVSEDFLHRYLPIAQGIVQRGDFLLDGRAPSPPIYPLILSGLLKIERSGGLKIETLAKIFNILVMAILSVVFFSLIKTVTDEKLALLSTAFWATYPFGIYLALLPGPEPLYLLSLILVVGTSLAVIRSEAVSGTAAMAAGAASGLAMMVKPMAIFLPLALVIFLAIVWIGKKQPWLRTSFGLLAFVIGLLLTILPWELYLGQRIGKFVPIADKAGSSIYDGWTFGLKTGFGGDRINFSYEVKVFMQEVSRVGRFSPSERVMESVIKTAVRYPRAFIKLLLIKIGRCWYGTDEMWHEGKILVIQIFYLALSLLGALSWFRSDRPGGWLMSVLAVILLYHWAAATVVLSILRYMMPAGFLMAVMMAFGAGRAWGGRIKI